MMILLLGFTRSDSMVLIPCSKNKGLFPSISWPLLNLCHFWVKTAPSQCSRDPPNLEQEKGMGALEVMSKHQQYYSPPHPCIFLPLLTWVRTGKRGWGWELLYWQQKPGNSRGGANWFITLEHVNIFSGLWADHLFTYAAFHAIGSQELTVQM